MEKAGNFLRAVWKSCLLLCAIAFASLSASARQVYKCNNCHAVRSISQTSVQNELARRCGNLPACRLFHSSRHVKAMNMLVVLVGNDAMQQFPLLGYGGIETTVEEIAWELHRMQVPFVAIGPARKDPPPYPFPVYDTAVSSNGAWNSRDAFAAQAAFIVDGLYDRSNKTQSFLVLGQSDWSQLVAAVPGVQVAVISHHDGNGPPNAHWDRGYEHVVHRFLSHDQRSRWLQPEDPRFKETVVIPHGLGVDDFDAASLAQPGQENVPSSICPDQGYFLWVASLDWGWEEKGLGLFIRLAQSRPTMRFVAYGHASREHGLVARAEETAKQLPNFEWKGRLARGQAHKEAFCGATAFLMPTQPVLGESFGMTVIEALSKGVPVIASTAASVPEVLGRPFGTQRRGTTPVGSLCDSFEDYLAALDLWSNRTQERSARVQAWAAERYAIGTVVDALLQAGLDRAKKLGIDV